MAVLLATLDGARFLDAQLASVAAQTVARIDLHASDDGSGDETPAILRRWQSGWKKGDFHVANGPGRGFSENFRSLATSYAADADYFAFCDQDDLWDPDKLAVAIAALAAVPPTTPALYCGRTRLIDEAGAPMGRSPLFRRPPGFRNAIVQSIGGGNTMLFNRAGFALFAESARRTAFVSHDWWAYIIVAGAGGTVVYDPAPHVDYRQHAANLVGHNRGLAARVRRIGLLLGGRFVDWTSANLDSLSHCDDLLSAEARQTLAAIRQIRAAPVPAALATLSRAGLYRQTALGNLGLVAAVALRRF